MKTTFGALGRLLRIAESVRLRREHFGGIAFDTRTGTTVDVDHSAFTALQGLRHRGVQREAELARDLCGRKKGADRLTRAHQIVGHLAELAILAPASEADVRQFVGAQTAGPETAERPNVSWPRGPHLTAPVTAHWAVTYQCTSSCPECYARRYAHWFPDELALPDALRVVQILANWGVFELAIGGGEPLQCPRLPAIVREAQRLGLVVHVTTGQHRVSASLLDELAGGITGLQIGVKADRLLGNPAAESAALAQTTTAAAEAGVHVGANVILSKRTLPHFERLLELLQKAHLTIVTLLRYKPPVTVAEWLSAKPSVADLQELESRLPEILRRHPEVNLRVDCALSFLQRQLASDEALARGIRGCVAGQRVVAVTPDGSAFPCSQLVHPRFCSGNLLTNPLEELWASSKVMRWYRLFRDKTAFGATTCGLCAAKEHCGGCRAFAADGRGAEPECPGPLVPPLEQLGKAGRRWDLARYLPQHGSISVRDYVQRYGVGQKRAIKELRASGCSLASGTGRKQSDIYEDPTADLNGDIQQIIGFTPGGVPFVSGDEVARWVAEDSDEADCHYPRWLRPQICDDTGSSVSPRSHRTSDRRKR